MTFIARVPHFQTKLTNIFNLKFLGKKIVIFYITINLVIAQIFFYAFYKICLSYVSHLSYVYAVSGKLACLGLEQGIYADEITAVEFTF